MLATVVSSSKAVLIVERDAPIRSLLRQVVSNAGYGCDAFAPDEISGHVADLPHHELAVIDVNVHDASGFRMLAEIAMQPDPPWVIVVTTATPEVIPRIPVSVVRLILRKPFDIPLLTACINAVMEASGEPKRGDRFAPH